MCPNSHAWLCPLFLRLCVSFTCNLLSLSLSLSLFLSLSFLLLYFSLTVVAAKRICKYSQLCFLLSGKTETTFGPLPNDAITGSVRHPLILQHTKKQGEITDVGSMVKQGIASTSPLNSPGRNNGPSGGIVIYYSPTSDPETQEKSHLSEKQYEISV